MSANPSTLEAVTEELRRVRRIAIASILLAVVSLAVAAAALVVPYNADLHAYAGRYLPAASPSPVVERAPVHETLEAKRFVLHDKEGRARADLAVNEDDWAHFTVLDGKGQKRASLEAGPKLVSLSLFRADGMTGAEVSVFDTVTQLHVFGPLGDKGARLGFARLAVDDDNPSLLLSTDGKSRVRLGVDDKEAVSLSLFDTDEQRRATLGSVGLETIKTGATEQTAESSLVLFDKKGNMIFRAPPE